MPMASRPPSFHLPLHWGSQLKGARGKRNVLEWFPGQRIFWATSILGEKKIFLYILEKRMFFPHPRISQKRRNFFICIYLGRPRKIPLTRASNVCLKSQHLGGKSRELGAQGYSWLHSMFGVSLKYMKLCLK